MLKIAYFLKSLQTSRANNLKSEITQDYSINNIGTEALWKLGLVQYIAENLWFLIDCDRKNF